MKTSIKLQTIDEVCGRPAGSFQQSLKEKEAYLKELDQERAKRIQESKLLAERMPWVA